MKIKTKKQLNLPQLLEWLLNSKYSSYIAFSNMGNYVQLEEYGALSFSDEKFYPEETFTVEVEEEITEDTVIPKLMTTFRKTCLNDDFGYQRVRIDEDFSIKLMLDKTEAHSDPVETLHTVNDDGTHTLIWSDGKIVEE